MLEKSQTLASTLSHICSKVITILTDNDTREKKKLIPSYVDFPANFLVNLCDLGISLGSEDRKKIEKPVIKIRKFYL